MPSLHTVLHGLAWLAAIHAFLRSSTPQGAVAWSLSLILFPLPILPIYLIFGSTHFRGYVEIARTGQMSRFGPEIQIVMDWFERNAMPTPEGPVMGLPMLTGLLRLPLVRGGELELLKDGQSTYERIRLEISRARHYVLVLYYKVEDDNSGKMLKQSLLDAASRGVSVYFVYDEMGSPRIGDFYRKDLLAAGVHVWSFRTARGWRHRLQWNFRNHRKLVVIDGEVALLGGLNVADRYLGQDPRFGAWRDTHLCLTGPAVLGVQLVFVEDYFWASGGKLPVLRWSLPEAGVTSQASPACSYFGFGPSDRQPKGLLFYLACISLAQRRLWLASPYFLPDPSILHALRLAALRGVDVRILLPPARFEPWMGLAARPFLNQLQGSGVEFWEYPHYNHSKLMLVDDHLSWVGSSNLDNRSLRLNFEGNLLVYDPSFNEQVASLLESDFQISTRLQPADLGGGGIRHRLLSPWVRLLAPLL